MNSPLPLDFLEKCTAAARRQVIQWWESLSGEKQSDVRVLLDRRQESLAYVYAKNESGELAWHTIPFADDELPIDEDSSSENELQLDYFQHLLDHPELIIDSEVVVRTFHICTQHLSAINAINTRAIDQSFSCSDGNVDCPIARFAADIVAGKLIGFTTHNRRSVWLCQLKDR